MAVKAETEAAIAATASKKIQDEVKPAVERIQSFFDRAFEVSKKGLERLETKIANGDEIDLKTFAAFHRDFTMWAAKFSASEAPKRLEVGGSVEQVHYLSDELVDRMTTFMTRHQTLLPAPAPKVIDAVVVESTS